MTQQTQPHEDDFLDDPFLTADTNLDTSGMSAELIAKMNAKFGRAPRRQEDGFDLRPQVLRSPAEEYRAMLQDPEIRKELAERDPAFADRFEAEEIDRIVTEFRQRNPDYLKTTKNAHVVIQSLAKKYLGKDWLDQDEAAAELWRAGKWSVDELTNQFKSCLRAGLLDVRRGTAKSLSESEELEVVALIRIGNLPAAIVRFVELSFSGKLPAYQSAEKFLAQQPELASQAAIFVWFNSQPSRLDVDEFKRFQSEKLSGVRLLTYQLVDQAWGEWRKENKPSYLFPNGINPEPSTREDLDDLSTQEIEDRYQQAVRDYRRGRSL